MKTRLFATLIVVGVLAGLAVTMSLTVVSASETSQRDEVQPRDAAPVAPGTSADDKRQLSDRLVAAPPVNPADNSTYLANAEQARMAASELRSQIPLPDGGDFSGVHWEVIDDGGISRAALFDVLLHNAACQWYSAIKDGTEILTARYIIAHITSWPTLRSGDSHQLFAAAATRIASGEADVGRLLAFCSS